MLACCGMAQFAAARYLISFLFGPSRHTADSAGKDLLLNLNLDFFLFNVIFRMGWRASQ